VGVPGNLDPENPYRDLCRKAAEIYLRRRREQHFRLDLKCFLETRLCNCTVRVKKREHTAVDIVKMWTLESNLLVLQRHSIPPKAGVASLLLSQRWCLKVHFCVKSQEHLSDARLDAKKKLPIPIVLAYQSMDLSTTPNLEYTRHLWWHK